MPISLFSCPTLGLAADAQPKIVTPLGTLTLDAEFDGVLIGDLKPSAAHQLERGGYRFSWTLDGFTAELLLCRPRFSLPAGMAVDDCWAGIWRLRTSVVNERPEFSCLWEPDSLWTERTGPESGEGLDAQTWENGSVRVTVGTVDTDWLSGHANRGLLPSRWADLLGWADGGIGADRDTGKIDPVVYLENGFRLVLPMLKAGEQCQVQFVAAWSGKPSGDGDANTDRNAISTWFAVDRSPEEILVGTGCS